MNRSEAFKSGYLSQDDLERPALAVIKSVGKELVNTDDNGQREKPVIYFTNGTKPLILNMVNWDTLEHAYGVESDGWLNQPIELFVDQNVMYGGKRVGGIRIRIPRTESAAPINFERAQAMCKEAGIDRPELIEHLKKNGRVTYNAARDSQLVRELLDSVNHAMAGVKEDDIPF